MTIEATVANASGRDGAEVVQVYVHEPDGDTVADEPAQRLVGFAKVRVPAGASVTAQIELDERWASHWDISQHAWSVRPGVRELRVGRSSRDVAFTLTTSVP